MTETWWCIRAHGDSLCGLLVQLCALDDILDDFFLVSPLLVVAPPYWPLVFTLEAKVLAGTTRVLTLVALLPSQTACEAPCRAQLVKRPSGTDPCMMGGRAVRTCS